jgi:hypothetical protein
MLYLAYTYTIQNKKNVILRATMIEADNVHEALIRSKKDLFNFVSIPEAIWNNVVESQRKAFLRANCFKATDLPFICNDVYKFSLNIVQVKLDKIKNKLVDMLSLSDEDFSSHFIQDILLGENDFFSKLLQKD